MAGTVKGQFDNVNALFDNEEAQFDIIMNQFDNLRFCILVHEPLMSFRAVSRRLSSEVGP